jgi:hypothetical protein
MVYTGPVLANLIDSKHHDFKTTVHPAPGDVKPPGTPEENWFFVSSSGSTDGTNKMTILWAKRRITAPSVGREPRVSHDL